MSLFLFFLFVFNVNILNCSKKNHACGSSKYVQICLAWKMRSGREREKWVIREIELTSSRSWIVFEVRTTYIRWCTCKLPHCAIDSDVAFWNDYLSPAGMHWREKHFSSPLQLFGSHSAGCVCLGTDLAKCASALGVSSGLRGLSPHGFIPFTGLLPGPWGTPNKRNANVAEGIFGNAGHVWATALQPNPP